MTLKVDQGFINELIELFSSSESVSRDQEVLFFVLCRILRLHIYEGYFHHQNRFGGVMVSVLTSSAVDRGFQLRSGQAKDYKIGICCFSAKHTVLRRKSKDWLARNQNNVSEWSDFSTRGLLFQ
jgi:hypothetical protein